LEVVDSMMMLARAPLSAIPLAMLRQQRIHNFRTVPERCRPEPSESIGEIDEPALRGQIRNPSVSRYCQTLLLRDGDPGAIIH
jgi:hypothetical protein